MRNLPATAAALALSMLVAEPLQAGPKSEVCTFLNLLMAKSSNHFRKYKGEDPDAAHTGVADESEMEFHGLLRPSDGFSCRYKNRLQGDDKNVQYICELYDKDAASVSARFKTYALDIDTCLAKARRKDSQFLDRLASHMSSEWVAPPYRVFETFTAGDDSDLLLQVEWQPAPAAQNSATGGKRRPK